MCNSGSSGVIPGKFTRVRFTYNDDLVFLKEFLAYNPMQTSDGWEIIKKHLELVTGKKFSIRALKQHLQLLIELWLKKDKVEKIRSGVEEPLSEKDSLLQEISTLCSEYNFQSKRKRPLSKEQQLCELGKKARNKYASIFIEDEASTEDVESESQYKPNIQHARLEEHDYVQSAEIQFDGEIEVRNDSAENGIISNNNNDNLRLSEIEEHEGTPQNTPKSGSNILRPTRKRLNKKKSSLREHALSYLSDKSEKERQIKEKELELEERKVSLEERRLSLEEKKLALEEKKLEIECKERLLRIDIEKEKAQIELCEKKISAQLMQSQQKLIDTILQKGDK